MSYSIAAVVKKGPFQAAGLRGGDKVHTIRNQKTGKTWTINGSEDLKKFRVKCTPGQTYTVSYTKAGETIVRNSTITPRKVAGKKVIGVGFKALVKKTAAAPAVKAPVTTPVAAKAPVKSGLDALVAAEAVKSELKAVQTAQAKSQDGAMLRDHRAASAKVDVKQDKFLADAKAEASEVEALMADMEAARKYLDARRSKIQLEADIHAKVEDAGKKVNAFLGVKDETVATAPKARSRKLNLLGKVLVAATLLGGIGTAVHYAAPRVMGYVASIRSAK